MIGLVLAMIAIAVTTCVTAIFYYPHNNTLNYTFNLIPLKDIKYIIYDSEYAEIKNYVYDFSTSTSVIKIIIKTIVLNDMIDIQVWHYHNNITNVYTLLLRTRHEYLKLALLIDKIFADAK